MGSKIDELRAELSVRGLDTSGTQRILIKRLDAALQSEEEKDKEKAKEIAPDEVGTEIVQHGQEKRKRSSNNGGNKAGDFLDEDQLVKHTVRELKELANRYGISASGTKMELVKKLLGVVEISKETVQDEAVEKVKEERLITDTKKALAVPNGCLPDKIQQFDEVRTDIVQKGRGKRKRSSNNGENKAGEFLDEDQLVKYTVRELKELATRYGISATGTKMDLVKKLSGVVEISKETVEDEAVEKVKEEKITAAKKSLAVPDRCLPDEIQYCYHVLQKDGEFYDATLNQTNVGGNNNKFYLIQALESDAGFKFLVYCRWGRVGSNGQDKLHGPFRSEEKAITEFELKFNDKTKNQWSNRKKFVSYPKYYTWLEIEHGEAGVELMAPKIIKPIDSDLHITKLEERVAKLISLICNIDMMMQMMLELDYNPEKLPLGKLSQSTILKGYDVLRRISDVVTSSNGNAERKKLEELSGEFYTVIPHDFGFRKMREFVIDTPFKVKSKLEMVTALGEIEIATKILQDNSSSRGDPLYSHYVQLGCEITPIELGSKEFRMLQKYLKNTHAKTHSNYKVDIVQLFKISRKDEIESFKKFSNIKNRMLLWHGSRLTNWTGILSKGLRIAPPEAPVTGYMFGKGVYFADMFSKSANYCCSSKDYPSGVLLLCEVALGDMVELFDSNCRANLLPDGKLSTKGVGDTAPDVLQAELLENGLVVPLGRPKPLINPKGNLAYNEYIVYNTEQIRMRYLVHVNFAFK